MTSKSLFLEILENADNPEYLEELDKMPKSELGERVVPSASRPRDLMSIMNMNRERPHKERMLKDLIKRKNKKKVERVKEVLSTKKKESFDDLLNDLGVE